MIPTQPQAANRNQCVSTGRIFTNSWHCLVVVMMTLVAVGGTWLHAGQIPASVTGINLSATNSTDLILNWSPVSLDIYGNPVAITNYNIYFSTNSLFAPDLAGHANRLGVTNAIRFVHKGAQTNTSSGFYYLAAVSANGTESLIFSNLIGNLVQNVVCQPGTNVYTWLALPPSVAWSNAASLGTQLATVDKLYHLVESNQTYEVWDAKATTGTNFPVIAGEAYGLELSTSTVLRIQGVYNSSPGFAWTSSSNQFNHHWMSLPANGNYSNAASLFNTIPFATKVAQYDPASGQFLSWFNLNGIWAGTNFTLNPAQGVLASVIMNFPWQPKLIYPRAGVNLQAGAGFLGLADLQATGTVVVGASPIVEYAWDYFGDGIMEISSTNPVTLLSLHLTNPVTCWPTYRVKDSRGFYGLGYARYDALSMSLSISNQAFRAGLNETGTVCFASSTNGYFSAYIYDASNNLVRVLESNVWHQAGSACLQWDGRDAGAGVVSNGVYYAVIEQTVNGAKACYDIKKLLLGTNVTSAITGIIVPSQFNPYSGGSFPIQYVLPTASRVTILIQDNNLNTIAVVCSNVLRAAGAQTDYWDGRLSSGAMITASTGFRVSLSAVAVGANAVIVQSALPTLSSLRSSKAKFTPSANPYGLSTNAAICTYSLDGPTNIRVIIRNTQGQIIQNGLETGKSTGQNLSAWPGTDSQGRPVTAGLYCISISPELNGQSGNSQSIWVQVYY